MTRPAGLGLALALGLATGTAAAETVRIRTGEHGTFTRIVVDRGSAGWSLGRAEGGYELRLAPATGYDLAAAFRLIRRDRVATLAPGATPGSLAIGLGCDCHATAFRTATGALVIDIADGAPSSGSPFEAPLESLAGPDGTGAPAPPGSTTDAGVDTRAEPSPGQAATGYAAAPDPRLALFWRGVRLPERSAQAPATRDRPAGADLPTPATPPAAPTAPSQQEATAGLVRSAANPLQEMAPHPASASGSSRAPHAPDGDHARAAPHDDNAPAVAEQESAPAPVPSPGHNMLPPLPDARVTEAQTELLRQLSRAASQGLVELTVDPLPPGDHADTSHSTADGEPAGPPGDPHADLADTEPQRTGAAQGDAVQSGAGGAGRPLPVHAETSIDRDMLSTLRAPVTAEGARCLPDGAFDIAAWGDDRPLAVQIAEKRDGLVGEFDRPDPAAVMALARLYLFFGFGAESRAVLRAFAVTPQDEAVLSGLGRILDGQTPGAEAPFATMTGCDSAAALWAVMAWPQLPPATNVDDGAVVRAFSALPPHLRRTLGPGLSERLIAAGATGAAASVRNAIARAPGDAGPALDLVEAKVAFAAGDPAAGQAELDPLARSNDPLAPEALILTIRSRLAGKQAVEPVLADSAEALAFEQRTSPTGAELTGLHILARASTGDFDRAFAASQGWPEATSAALRNETAAGLFAMLAEKSDDRGFLAHYFRHRALFEDASPDLMLRLDVADRLAAAGFPGELRRVLAGEAGYTDRGRRLLARAALDEFAPDRALEELAGLAGPEAEALTAEALALRGDHAAAAARFEALGEVERAGLEAWRGGDTAKAAALGPGPLRETLGQITGGTPAAGRAPPPGEGGDEIQAAAPLAAGRALVAQSRATREALSTLLAAPDPAPASGAGSSPATGAALPAEDAAAPAGS